MAWIRDWKLRKEGLSQKGWEYMFIIIIIIIIATTIFISSKINRGLL